MSTRQISPRRLPSGVQSFRMMREEQYIYVDKTDLIWELINGPAVQFIARPRRFGKSLMISTLQSYFQGEGHLFEGLRIAQLRAEAGVTEWVRHPTFFFGFSASGFSERDDVRDVLDRWLRQYEGEYGLSPSGPIGSRTAQLIIAAHEQSGLRPVILVDEYDNPLTDTLLPAQRELHEHYKRELRGFYKAIKETGEHLQLVVVTGITQFTELSLFSGVNQMQDMTLLPRYATLFGLTEGEMVEAFGPEIAAMAAEGGITPEEQIDRLRHEYDGYRFTTRDVYVYNPQSVIFSLEQRQLGNYWARTGTPALLATVFPTYTFDFQMLTGTIYLDELDMLRLDFTGRNPIPLLYQTGYLTIKGFDSRTNLFDLGFPNHEVETSFWRVLLEIFGPSVPALRRAQGANFLRQLNEGRVEQAMCELLALIAGIPYSAVATQKLDATDILEREEKRRAARLRVYEELFQVALYAWFTALGCDVRAEPHSVRGRADVVLELPSAIYIFELKVTHGQETGQTALAQIRSKAYAEPHRAKGKPIFGIGAAFDLREETRGDCDWAWEEI